MKQLDTFKLWAIGQPSGTPIPISPEQFNKVMLDWWHEELAEPGTFKAYTYLMEHIQE